MESATVTETPEVIYGQDFLDYQKAKVRYDRRISDWAAFRKKAEQNRKDRYLDINVQNLRDSGDIGEDETIVPTRVIHSNIRRDAADAMAFLNGSARLVFYRCLDDPAVDCRQLESEITKGLTYPGWFKEYESHYDGAALHGWDSMEVIYDSTKPLSIGFEHVGYSKLLFNPKLSNIQNDEFVMREYEASCTQLEDFVKNNGFDKAQVGVLLQRTQDSSKKDDTFTIYKVYFKYADTIWVAWYSKDGDVREYIRTPEPLRCGLLIKAAPEVPNVISIGGDLANGPSIPSSENVANSVSIGQPPPLAEPPVETFQEAPVKMFPYFVYIYEDDEQEAVSDHKGRAFFDQPQQEARTAIKSGFVNGVSRACDVYAAPKDDNPENVSKLEEVVLENGKILPVAIQFHTQPFPDPMILQAMQYMDMENSQQTGKMATAVSNRKDARKTAKELDLASGEEQKLVSTNLAGYSEFLRLMYNFAWPIIQSQAIAGKVKLLRKKVQVPTGPALMHGQAPVMEEQMVNDIETISKEYDIRPAGDVDVVQKQQQLQQMQQDWPVFQAIPGLSSRFLEKYIRLRYPQDADELIAAMQQGDMGKQLIVALLTTLKGSLQPEELAALSPQERMQLTQLVAQSQEYIAGPATTSPAQAPA